jgi:hypothetical protein
VKARGDREFGLRRKLNSSVRVNWTLD